MSANLLRVNPTRQELLRLKKGARTAQRGHKLLKDKRDGLMREFLKIIQDARALRTSVERELNESFVAYGIAQALGRKDALAAQLSVPTRKVTLTVETANVMSVQIPRFDVLVEGEAVNYGFAHTPAMLDTAVVKLAKLIPELLRLAAIEHAARLLAEEIEKTRRRVNALEHTVIPSMKLTAKSIQGKLNEQERSTITALMKVKEMIS